MHLEIPSDSGAKAQELPKVMVDRSLYDERILFKETYSPEARDRMGARLAALEQLAITHSEQWSGVQERLEAGKAMGDVEVSPNVLEEAQLKANWYSKLRGAFRAGGGSAPDRVGAIIDFLRACEPHSNTFEKTQIQNTVGALLELLAKP